jgi:acetyl esterase/lipase
MMPLAQARRMARRLSEAGVVHQLLIVDGATHEDPVFHSDAVLGAVAGWVGHRA